MKAILLTDAETKLKVLVVFGAGGCVYAKSAKDNEGEYTELFNEESKAIVSVLESPEVISNQLRMFT